MNAITPATLADLEVLAQLARQTFLESHRHSASREDIEAYINKQYSNEVMRKELEYPRNCYHLISYHEKPIGFSKIILHCAHPEIDKPSLTKLDRIYLLQEYHSLKLGAALFAFNLALSKQQGDTGMWLYVWKENERAIRFYERQGFTIIGSHDFRISETHSNPNHLMYLPY
ncbi:MAG TPA: N-acetyltransferase [Ferruginibacter sp.]|nr:N-acetyltransferase [Ferruginibacter sp.]